MDVANDGPTAKTAHMNGSTNGSSLSPPGHYKGHQRKVSSSQVFKDMTKRDSMGAMAHELDKLLKTAPQDQEERNRIQEEMRGFQRLYQKFLSGTGPGIQWDMIESPSPDKILNYNQLTPQADPRRLRDMLNKLCVIKLNGGLGTSMGCTGPKSIISVRNDLTFLDLTVQQIEHLNKTYDADVPLVLMNSFNTDEDTQKVLRKYRGFRVKIYTFMQSRYPRINRETLLPIANSLADGDSESWYPPGHGDFYDAFSKSGLLEEFLSQGNRSSSCHLLNKT